MSVRYESLSRSHGNWNGMEVKSQRRESFGSETEK